MALRGEVRSPEALGQMLQQGRLLRGLSQRQLAEELGIGQKWIWELENGKPGLFTERLFQVLRTTGCRLYVELDESESGERDHNG
jgi:HTH-type transcriptional regulator / antitoxin HipB